MYDTWGLGDREASVKTRRKNLLAGAAIAAVVVILVVASVFYILPAVLPGFFKGSNIELFVEKPVNLIYDDTYRVVRKSVSDVMSEPSPSSERVTQVLYNEPVKILADNMGDGYTLIKTVDGIEGYVKSSDLLSGTIDWPAVMKAIRDVGYDDVLTAELRGVGNTAYDCCKNISEDMDKILEM